MRRATFASAAAVCALVPVVLLAPSPASARPVTPGEVVAIAPGDYAPADGSVLLERETGVSFASDAPDALGIGGVFVTRVVREAARDGLTFVYEMFYSPVAIPESGLAPGGFAGYATDVVADGRAGTIARSDDGATLTVVHGPDVVSLAVVVRTDAPDFDENGVVNFTATVEEFDGSLTPYFLRLPGTIQPTGDPGRGGPVIPLPPALVPGLATLGGLALARGACHHRRRHARA